MKCCSLQTRLLKVPQSFSFTMRQHCLLWALFLYGRSDAIGPKDKDREMSGYPGVRQVESA